MHLAAHTLQYPADRDVLSHLVALNDNQRAWILMWLKPHSQKEHVMLFQMPDYICHTQDCLRASV